MTTKEFRETEFPNRCPEELDGTLYVQNANVNCCRFNRRGTLVAVGATDGRVYIFDFLTRNIVQQFAAHVGPITTLSWSRDGHTLLSASLDRRCAVWDVSTGRLIASLGFPDPIIYAQFNPRDDNELLVLGTAKDPVLKWVDTKISKVLSTSVPLLEEDAVSCVAYDRKGEHVIAGTSKGRILIYDVKTQNLLSIVKHNSVHQVRSIVVPRSGCFILTNSFDRVIRRFDLDQLIKGGTKGELIEPVQKLSDTIDRAGWKSVCCSYDGEYICGASTKDHALYIWDCSNGSLIKILRGQGEGMHEVQWHPTKTVVLSVANETVSVWTQAQPEHWTAYAPDFTELVENTKPKETEGTYDMEDEDAPDENENEDVDVEDEDVDVVTVEADDVGGSSDEENAGLPTHSKMTTGPLLFLSQTPNMGKTEEPQPEAPYADLSFLHQPAGGMPMEYRNNDVRRQMAAASSMTAATANQMVKMPYRSSN